jgi:hypothetical protein
MLDIAQVRAIAEEVVRDKLGTRFVENVYAEEALDWVGDEALIVRVILLPNAAHVVREGRKVTATLSSLREQLQKHGDERFPLIRYATAADLRREKRARAKS